MLNACALCSVLCAPACVQDEEEIDLGSLKDELMWQLRQLVDSFPK